MSTPLNGIVLAAGKGKRMKSDLPKCLHEVCGIPMAELVGRAMIDAGVPRPVIVVGHGGSLLEDRLGDGYAYAWQHDQLGTGHAALQGLSAIEGDGPVLICPGDVPLVQPDLFKRALDAYRAGAMVVVVTAEVADPTKYGRIVRRDGSVAAIVEHDDADEEIRAIHEINSGIFCADAGFLRRVLPSLSTENEQGEYLLTDIVKVAVAEGVRVEGIVVGEDDVRGVNDRWQLAEASSVFKTEILKRHAKAGVTILDPISTWVGPLVEVGEDTILEPGTQLLGRTKVGRGCRIGPNSLIEDSVVGDNCIVFMSRVCEALMEAGSKCGPFANLRPGAKLRKGAKIGNFVEVKNAEIGEDTAVSHLTYIGDAEIGPGSNIGAGVITCNYDGYRKLKTKVGAGVFVGSNSTLVAPVTLGDGAFVAAASVVSSGEYPADAMIVGRSRTETKPEWAAQWRKKHEPKDPSNDEV